VVGGTDRGAGIRVFHGRTQAYAYTNRLDAASLRGAAGVAASDLWAYAGHDAGVLARHVPAAMLFVRNPTGISHHPEEFSSEGDCLAGCRVLAGALAELVARV